MIFRPSSSCFWMIWRTWILRTNHHHIITDSCWWTLSSFYRMSLQIMMIWSQGNSSTHIDHFSNKVMAYYVLPSCLNLIAQLSQETTCLSKDLLIPKTALFFVKMIKDRSYEIDREVKVEEKKEASTLFSQVLGLHVYYPNF